MARRQAAHNVLKAAKDKKILQEKIAKQLAAEVRVGDFGPAPRKSARICGKTAEKVAPLCTLRHKATVPFLGCSTSIAVASLGIAIAFHIRSIVYRLLAWLF